MGPDILPGQALDGSRCDFECLFAGRCDASRKVGFSRVTLRLEEQVAAEEGPHIVFQL